LAGTGINVHFHKEILNFHKGLSIKNVRSQEGCLFSADKGKGVLQVRTSALFGAKSFEFFKIMVCPHGQDGGRGVKPLRTRGRGSIFCDFVWTSFMFGP